MAQRGLLYFMGRWDLREESPYGTEGGTYGTNLLTEPLTGLFNYGAEALTGRVSFQDF